MGEAGRRAVSDDGKAEAREPRGGQCTGHGGKAARVGRAFFNSTLWGRQVNTQASRGIMSSPSLFCPMVLDSL